MTRRANPTRIGLFAILGLALLAAAVVTVSGGRLFTSTERAVMHFSGSIYGLQLGAPVVFRGVRLGSVVSIGVVHDAASGRFAIPVVAELDRNLITDLHGARTGAKAALSLGALVAQGLSAQLATQSLLTGLLYIDLDLRPSAAAVGSAPGATGAPAATAVSAAASAPTATAPTRAAVRSDALAELVEIPTVETTLEALKTQLENLNLGALVADVSTIANSTRKFVDRPELQQALQDFAQVAADVKQLVARLDQRIDPMANAVQGTLADTRRMTAQLGAAAASVSASAERIGATADRVSGTFGRIDGVLAESAPLMKSLQRAADELAQSAAGLRAATADDSMLMGNVERASQDVSRASRAVRELADLLERHPEALIRGKAAP
jgi:paraquat-inducible protein B